MIMIAIASAITMTAMQATINAPRAAFVACLKAAGEKAKSEKVAADAYGAYIRAQCEAQATSFKSALVSFDVKNGISRKQAQSDADLQIDDYVVTQEGAYEARAVAKPSTPPAPAQSPTPAPTPASTPASTPQ